MLQGEYTMDEHVAIGLESVGGPLLDAYIRERFWIWDAFIWETYKILVII